MSAGLPLPTFFRKRGDYGQFRVCALICTNTLLSNLNTSETFLLLTDYVHHFRLQVDIISCFNSCSFALHPQ